MTDSRCSHHVMVDVDIPDQSEHERRVCAQCNFKFVLESKEHAPVEVSEFSLIAAGSYEDALVHPALQTEFFRALGLSLLPHSLIQSRNQLIEDPFLLHERTGSCL